MLETTLNYVTWDVSPTVIEIFGREIRWYGLLFAMGFVLSYPIIRRMFRHEGIQDEVFDKMVLYSVIATIVGARLGHVFFYGFDHYMSNPIEIIKVWEGGLASHGGAIGLIIAMWIFAKRVSKKHILWGLDRLVIGTALTGFFIRLGNLFNSEIAGKVTSSSFGWYFPRYVRPEGTTYEGQTDSWLVEMNTKNGMEWPEIVNNEAILRYPTQIYEAAAYLLIFFFLLYMYWKRDAGKKYGLLFGWFLTLIFGVRVLVEFIKENQADIDKTSVLNMGQILSLPLVLVGVFFVWAGYKRLFNKKDQPTDS